MSEEVKAYEPQPRGAARIAGVDLASIDARLEECEAFFLKHVDETDYRNLDWYLQRAQLRFAAGDDIYEVIDDAFLAARCLHDRHAMHLELKPPEMFMTRRITPVELGIVSGMPMLTLEFSATYGLPLMMIMSQTAPEEIQNEANLMTSYFRRGFCADYYELASLSAVIYAGVIAALGRGFDDEAILGLSTYAKARDSLRGMPPASLLPKIKRYDALNTALACICNGSFELIPGVLAPLAEEFLEDQHKRLGAAFLAPDKMPAPKYFDLSILTIMALTALRETVLEFPEAGAIAQYNHFTRGFMEMPERRIEIPALNEESRRILEQAGVDPDQLNRDYADDGYRSAKEESEAKANAIFEEKQRQVQRAVQERIAQGIAQEDAHTSVKPEVYVHEELKLDAEGVEAEGRFSSFFEGDERDEEAERRANFYGEDEDEEIVDTGKSFDGFFETGDDRSDLNHDDQEPPSSTIEGNVAGDGKSFSAFFDKNDALDAAIRETVESDDQHDPDAGKNFASFFENLDPSVTAPFDDDSDESTREAVEPKTFTKDFFATDGPQTELSMASESSDDDDPTETEAIKEFSTNFFADDAPKTQLQMETTAAPSEEKAPTDISASVVSEPEVLAKTPTDTPFTKDFFDNDRLRTELQSAATSPLNASDAPRKNQEHRTFNSDFFENDRLRTELKNAETLPLNAAETPKESPTGSAFTSDFFADNRLRSELLKTSTPSLAPVAAATPPNEEKRDFTKIFTATAPGASAALKMAVDDDVEAKPVMVPKEADPVVQSKRISAQALREAQIRELEEAHAQKLRADEAAKEANRLRLRADESEEDLPKLESFDERAARLIREKQDAIRESALRERAEAERELEELKARGVQRPIIEALQLTPDAPRDADDVVEKLGFDDLVIQGFAYTDLDMIHANTAVREELEEDFDMHAALAEQRERETALATETAIPSEEPAQDEDFDMHAALAKAKEQKDK